MTTKISGNAQVNLIRNYDLVWMSKAIGEPFALRDDLAGVPLPSVDNAAYRFIKLSAGDTYNSGVLVNEILSGTDPLIIATADINFADSPLNGLTVNLWNTERRSPRAGSAGVLQDDALQNITGNIGLRPTNGGGNMASISSGPFKSDYDSGSASVEMAAGSTTYTLKGVSFDASRVVRADDETRVRNQGVTYYMRIL